MLLTDVQFSNDKSVGNSGFVRLVETGGDCVHEDTEFEISSMVSFMSANRNKIMQICLDDDKNLDLSLFEMIFQNIIENNIRSALVASTRITVIIFNILDVNNIRY